MDNEHWFDTLNKSLIRAAPRRKLLRAVATAAASLTLGAVPVTEAAKNRKKKKKGKRNGKKDKPNPNRAPSCSGGACAREWPGDQDEIDFCELVCQQCDGADPREFCILKPSGGDKVAWCCEDATCCGNWCCPDRDECCDPGGGRRPTCLTAEQWCCPDDVEYGWCDLATHICCPGVGCVEGLECPDPGCPDGLPTRCGPECVDTVEDGRHCGECDNSCGSYPAGCCESQCCGGDGFPERLFRCCEGRCVNWATDENNCGRDCQQCPAERSLCCAGACFDGSRWTCCPDGITACQTDRPYPWGCVQADNTPAGWTCGQL